MGVTTTDQLSAPLQATLMARVLSNEIPDNIHTIPALKETLPNKGGMYARFFRYNKLTVDTVSVPDNSVTETTPEALSNNFIDAQLKTYMKIVAISRIVTLTDQTKPLNQAVHQLGLNLSETQDTLTKKVMESAINVYNCVDGTNGDTPSEITDTDILDIIKVLMSKDAKTAFRSVRGSDRFGSAPILDGYFALGHTDIYKDLRGVSGFVSRHQYGVTENVPKPEVGAVDRARFLLSSNGSYNDGASANGNRVYNVFYCGVESVGIVDQDGMSTELIYKPPIYHGATGMYCTLAWVTRMAHQIMNQNWIVKQRCTLS